MRQQNYYNLKTEYSNKNYNINDTTLDLFNMIIFSMDLLFLSLFVIRNRTYGQLGSPPIKLSHPAVLWLTIQPPEINKLYVRRPILSLTTARYLKRQHIVSAYLIEEVLCRDSGTWLKCCWQLTWFWNRAVDSLQTVPWETTSKDRTLVSFSTFPA